MTRILAASLHEVLSSGDLDPLHQPAILAETGELEPEWQATGSTGNLNEDAVGGWRTASRSAGRISSTTKRAMQQRPARHAAGGGGGVFRGLHLIGAWIAELEAGDGRGGGSGCFAGAGRCRS